jgi:hypothetical protein
MRLHVEPLDRLVIGRYERRFGPAAPSTTRMHARIDEVGRVAAVNEIVDAADSIDRRLGYLLTAGAFVVAIAGFKVGPRGSEITVQGLLDGFGGLLGAAAAIAALRGATLRVERFVLELDSGVAAPQQLVHIDTRRARLGLKRAWAHLAARLLLYALMLVGVAAVLNGLPS